MRVFPRTLKVQSLISFFSTALCQNLIPCKSVTYCSVTSLIVLDIFMDIFASPVVSEDQLPNVREIIVVTIYKAEVLKTRAL